MFNVFYHFVGHPFALYHHSSISFCRVASSTETDVAKNWQSLKSVAVLSTARRPIISMLHCLSRVWAQSAGSGLIGPFGYFNE